MYFIAAPELKTPSKLPKYLDERFRSKSKTYDNFIFVTARRSKMIYERKKKINDKYEKVSYRLDAMAALKLQSKEIMFLEISRKLDAAKCLRESNFKQLYEKYRLSNSRVTFVKKNVEKKRLKKSLTLSKNIYSKQLLAFYRRSLAGKKSETGLNPQTAATKIQIWWRFRVSKDLLFKLLKSTTKVKSCNFEEASRIVLDLEIIDLFSNFFKMLNLESKINSKTFLSGVILLLHFDEVINERDEAEVYLKTIFFMVFKLFEFLLSSYSSSQYATYSSMFRKIWIFYKEIFGRWKLKDKKRIIESTISHFCELSKIWSVVSSEEGSSVEFHAELYNQQVHLLSQLKKMGDVAAFRLLKIRLKKLNLRIVPKEFKFCLPRPVFIASVERPVVHEVTENLDIFESNLLFGHEIMVNPDFQLPDAFERNNLADNFDMLNKLNEQRKGELVLDALSSIRRMLIEVAPKKGEDISIIKDVIDLDLMNHQIVGGYILTRVPALCKFILELMAKYCAPSRDSSIKSLMEKDGICFLLEIHDLLILMKRDLANFHIQQIRITMKDSFVQYERDTFKSKAVPHTEAWLSSFKSETSHLEIFNNAFIHLLKHDFSVHFPETLALDVHRINSISKTVKEIINKGVLVNLLHLHMNSNEKD
eukprot:NODE_943_length_2959_cov_0.532517.p1 type:complete len:648 gc:universal NODE_943_length_2959_cov_0.532517:995-2938(+)